MWLWKWLRLKAVFVSKHINKRHTMKPAECFTRLLLASMCDCFTRLPELWKVTVQGESAKRRPESIQHFLFLVSVFLFGERDLYCRARYFTRKKVSITGVQENTFRKISLWFPICRGESQRFGKMSGKLIRWWDFLQFDVILKIIKIRDEKYDINI